MKRKQQDENEDAVEKSAWSGISSSSSTNNTMNSDIVLQSASYLSQKQDYIFHGGKLSDFLKSTSFLRLIA